MSEKERNGITLTDVFGDSDGGNRGVDFTDAAGTPGAGRVRPSEEESNVLAKIDELEGSEVEPAVPHDIPGGTAYVPVADSMLAYVERRRKEGKGFTLNDRLLNWWTDSGLMPQHQWILLNPLTLADRNYHYEAKVCRDYMGATRGTSFVLADSGGYQIATSRELEVTDEIGKHDCSRYVHPHRILEWQIANADAGTIIDEPPFDYSDEARKFSTDDFDEWYDGLFQDCLSGTTANARSAIRRWEEIDYDGFTPMAVLHGMPRQDGKGDPIESHKQWYEALQDVYDWEGWSLASGSGDSPGLLAFGLAFSDNYIDCDLYHVLGQGNVWARVLSKLYAQLTDSFVTHDGTGYKIGSMYSAMYIPTTYMKSLRVTDRTDDPEDSRYEKLEAKRMPCGCGVCRQVEAEMGAETLFEKPGTERMVIMDLHNLSHLLRRFHLLDAFVEARGVDLLDEVVITEEGEEPFPLTVHPKSEFWRILSNWMSTTRVAEMYFAMDFLVTAIEEDIETALDQYWIRTPFFDHVHGPMDRDERPSIRRQSTNSVFEGW